MTDREVYTKAAMKTMKGTHYSCNAIFYPGNKNNVGTVAQRNRYRVAFGFEPDLAADGQWLQHDDPFLEQFPGGKDGKELRVLCLLMMAAVCDDI